MVATLHRALAYGSIALFVLIAIAAARSAVRRLPDRLAAPLDALVLVVVAVVALLGIGLLLSGRAPRELLHYVYAVVAFTAVPVADLVALDWDDRRRGIARLVAASVGIAVVLRSSATG